MTARPGEQSLVGAGEMVQHELREVGKARSSGTFLGHRKEFVALGFMLAK